MSVCCLSGRLSNALLWQNEKNLCPHSYTSHERPFILGLRQEEWLVGNDLFYLKFYVKLSRLDPKRRFSIDIRSKRASAVTPSEKSSINTNRKSTTRIPILSLRQTLYIASEPQRGIKNDVFRIKLHFTWRKSVQSFFAWVLSATES